MGIGSATSSGEPQKRRNWGRDDEGGLVCNGFGQGEAVLYEASLAVVIKIRPQ